MLEYSCWFIIKNQLLLKGTERYHASCCLFYNIYIQTKYKYTLYTSKHEIKL